MPLFTNPSSFVNLPVSPSFYNNAAPTPHASHPSFPYLALLVFEAVLEVVCVSLPGYIVARLGMFDAEAQKFVANLNVVLFTPCLIFTKLGSQLTAEKISDLTIIPVIFVVQTVVSYLSAAVVSRCFNLRKRQSSFVTAMGVFANSNSLPISLVISLSKTISGLHWDRVPNDNDDEVAARGILYLLIFQQLGQLLRWSWGYRVLLAPREQFERDEEDRANARIASGDAHGHANARYSDNPSNTDDHTVVGSSAGHLTASPSSSSVDAMAFSSGDQTPVDSHSPPYANGHNKNNGLKDPSSDGSDSSGGDDGHGDNEVSPHLTMPNGSFVPRQSSTGNIIRFPDVEAATDEPAKPTVDGVRAWAQQRREAARASIHHARKRGYSHFKGLFASLPAPLQRACRSLSRGMRRFARGVWGFMNPPLWAMLVAVVVASIPALQRVVFEEGSFLRNSVTMAIEQNGGVAVPLILVVLGANLERSTLQQQDRAPDEDEDDPREERNLIIASLLARMLIPTLVMGPLLALTAKFVPVSILDDPIFVVVCFLLTGAPSALQLAQICQLNDVFVGAMSRLLFQSYVVWILPSTLLLVLCAIEVVEWATA